MAYKVLISKEAEVEFAVAECYFRVKGLHEKFLADFSKQLAFLESTPLAFQQKYRAVRIICFNNFNYSIHFIVKEKQVLVLRILNQRQDF